MLQGKKLKTTPEKECQYTFGKSHSFVVTILYVQAASNRYTFDIFQKEHSKIIVRFHYLH